MDDAIAGATQLGILGPYTASRAHLRGNRPNRPCKNGSTTPRRRNHRLAARMAPSAFGACEHVGDIPAGHIAVPTRRIAVGP